MHHNVIIVELYRVTGLFTSLGVSGSDDVHLVHYDCQLLTKHQLVILNNSVAFGRIEHACSKKKSQAQKPEAERQAGRSDL